MAFLWNVKEPLEVSKWTELPREVIEIVLKNLSQDDLWTCRDFSSRWPTVAKAPGLLKLVTSLSPFAWNEVPVKLSRLHQLEICNSQVQRCLMVELPGTAACAAMLEPLTYQGLQLPECRLLAALRYQVDLEADLAADELCISDYNAENLDDIMSDSSMASIAAFSCLTRLDLVCYGCPALQTLGQLSHCQRLALHLIHKGLARETCCEAVLLINNAGLKKVQLDGHAWSDATYLALLTLTSPKGQPVSHCTADQAGALECAIRAQQELGLLQPDVELHLPKMIPHGCSLRRFGFSPALHERRA
ncbi:hypothetical protein WJX77_010369 [Trebouxia sp. C0004]